MPAQPFRLVGDIDVRTVPAIAEDLDAAIRACDDEFVIDCAGLTFIDSSGIGVLVRAREDLQGRGHLRIVNMPSTGRRAIEAVGLSDYLGLDSESA